MSGGRSVAALLHLTLFTAAFCGATQNPPFLYISEISIIDSLLFIEIYNSGTVPIDGATIELRTQDTDGVEHRFQPGDTQLLPGEVGLWCSGNEVSACTAKLERTQLRTMRFILSSTGLNKSELFSLHHLHASRTTTLDVVESGDQACAATGDVPAKPSLREYWSAVVGGTDDLVLVRSARFIDGNSGRSALNSDVDGVAGYCNQFERVDTTSCARKDAGVCLESSSVDDDCCAGVHHLADDATRSRTWGGCPAGYQLSLENVTVCGTVPDVALSTCCVPLPHRTLGWHASAYYCHHASGDYGRHQCEVLTSTSNLGSRHLLSSSKNMGLWDYLLQYHTGSAYPLRGLLIGSPSRRNANTPALTGPISVLAQLTSLIDVDLQSNLLTGSLPDLTELAALRSLRLGNNRLGGTIAEKTILSLASLEILDVSANQLQGCLDERLCPLVRDPNASKSDLQLRPWVEASSNSCSVTAFGTRVCSCVEADPLPLKKRVYTVMREILLPWAKADEFCKSVANELYYTSGFPSARLGYAGLARIAHVHDPLDGGWLADYDSSVGIAIKQAIDSSFLGETYNSTALWLGGKEIGFYPEHSCGMAENHSDYDRPTVTASGRDVHLEYSYGGHQCDENLGFVCEMWISAVRSYENQSGCHRLSNAGGVTETTMAFPLCSSTNGTGGGGPSHLYNPDNIICVGPTSTPTRAPFQSASESPSQVPSFSPLTSPTPTNTPATMAPTKQRTNFPTSAFPTKEFNSDDAPEGVYTSPTTSTPTADMRSFDVITSLLLPSIESAALLSEAMVMDLRAAIAFAYRVAIPQVVNVTITDVLNASKDDAPGMRRRLGEHQDEPGVNQEGGVLVNYAVVDLSPHEFVSVGGPPPSHNDYVSSDPGMPKLVEVKLSNATSSSIEDAIAQYLNDEANHFDSVVVVIVNPIIEVNVVVPTPNADSPSYAPSPVPVPLDKEPNESSGIDLIIVIIAVVVTAMGCLTAIYIYRKKAPSSKAGDRRNKMRSNSVNVFGEGNRVMPEISAQGDAATVGTSAKCEKETGGSCMLHRQLFTDVPDELRLDASVQFCSDDQEPTLSI